MHCHDTIATCYSCQGLLIVTWSSIDGTIPVVLATEDSIELGIYWSTWSSTIFNQVHCHYVIAAVSTQVLVSIITRLVINNTIPRYFYSTEIIGKLVIGILTLWNNRSINCICCNSEFACCSHMSIYIIYNAQSCHIGLGESMLLSLIWSKACRKGIVSSTTCHIIIALYNCISSFITPNTWFDLNASILSETHIYGLILKSLPTRTFFEEDIHICTLVCICPPVAIFRSDFLMTFATSWPYPNIDLISPICWNFRLNSNTCSCHIIIALYNCISSFITPNTWFDLNASILSETHIYGLILKSLPTRTFFEEDIHICTLVCICPPVAIFRSDFLMTFATSWPYPNVDLISP